MDVSDIQGKKELKCTANSTLQCSNSEIHLESLLNHFLKEILLNSGGEEQREEQKKQHKRNGMGEFLLSLVMSKQSYISGRIREMAMIFIQHH